MVSLNANCIMINIKTGWIQWGKGKSVCPALMPICQELKRDNQPRHFEFLWQCGQDTHMWQMRKKIIE